MRRGAVKVNPRLALVGLNAHWQRNPLAFTGPSITFAPFSPLQKIAIDLLGVGYVPGNGNGKKKNPPLPGSLKPASKSVSGGTWASIALELASISRTSDPLSEIQLRTSRPSVTVNVGEFARLLPRIVGKASTRGTAMRLYERWKQYTRAFGLERTDVYAMHPLSRGVLSRGMESGGLETIFSFDLPLALDLVWVISGPPHPLGGAEGETRAREIIRQAISAGQSELAWLMQAQPTNQAEADELQKRIKLAQAGLDGLQAAALQEQYIYSGPSEDPLAGKWAEKHQLAVLQRARAVATGLDPDVVAPVEMRAERELHQYAPGYRRTLELAQLSRLQAIRPTYEAVALPTPPPAMEELELEERAPRTPPPGAQAWLAKRERGAGEWRKIRKRGRPPSYGHGSAVPPVGVPDFKEWEAAKAVTAPQRPGGGQKVVAAKLAAQERAKRAAEGEALKERRRLELMEERRVSALETMATPPAPVPAPVLSADLMNNVVQGLKILKKRHRSQAEAARAVGISAPYFSLLLNRKSKSQPSLDAAKRILVAAGLDVPSTEGRWVPAAARARMAIRAERLATGIPWRPALNELLSREKITYLAKRLGVRPGNLHNWTTGRLSPSREEQLRVMELLAQSRRGPSIADPSGRMAPLELPNPAEDFRAKLPKRKRNRDSKWKSPPPAREISLEEAQKLPGYEKALKKFRRFHSTDPAMAAVVRINDGKPGVTRKGPYVALGHRVETIYQVPWTSNKNESDKDGRPPTIWFHEHAKNAPPMILLDPETGMTMDVGGNYLVDDWYYS